MCHIQVLMVVSEFSLSPVVVTLVKKKKRHHSTEICSYPSRKIYLSYHKCFLLISFTHALAFLLSALFCCGSRPNQVTACILQVLQMLSGTLWMQMYSPHTHSRPAVISKPLSKLYSATLTANGGKGPTHCKDDEDTHTYIDLVTRQ